MTPQIGITTSYQDVNDEASLVTVSGELDLFSLEEFKTVLNSAETAGHDLIVLDLRELSFIDSSGLGAIIGLKGRAQKSHKRVIVCPSEVVTKTFEVTGLHRVLQSADRPEDVLPA
jgi:anti-sigma B factor antagonist